MQQTVTLTITRDHIDHDVEVVVNAIYVDPYPMETGDESFVDVESYGFDPVTKITYFLSDDEIHQAEEKVWKEFRRQGKMQW